jgi:hypothetical protein
MFNTVFFIISKIVLKATGSSLMNMMKTAGDVKKEKKKMKGPTIDMKDLE